MWRVDGVRDKYKRFLAETENVRQRLMKQVQWAKVFGIHGFCKDSPQKRMHLLNKPRRPDRVSAKSKQFTYLIFIIIVFVVCFGSTRVVVV